MLDQAQYDVKERALAATGRADDADKFPLGDREVQIGKRCNGLAIFRPESEREILCLYERGHDRSRRRYLMPNS